MTAHAEAPTPLSDMIREASDGGLTYQQMADRSDQDGHPLSRQYFHKIADNRTAYAPTVERLKGIAAGLRRPLPVVQRAAAEQYLHYEATELSGYDEDVRVIVAHLAGMDARERRRWQAMIEASEQAAGDS